MVEYKEIEGFRFDKRISEQDVAIIMDKLHDYKRDTRAGTITNTLTRFEHLVAGSTFLFASPLTPYAHLFETKTPEEINKEREQKKEYPANSASISGTPLGRGLLYRRVHQLSGESLFKDFTLDYFELVRIYKEGCMITEGTIKPTQHFTEGEIDLAESFSASGLDDLVFWMKYSRMDEVTGIAQPPQVIRITGDYPEFEITDKDILKEFGYRIPLQDHSSTFNNFPIDQRIKAYIDLDGYYFVIE
ncbi:hypothetical protein ACFL0W_04540 [Nanoarchaeota archaeon]